MPSAVRTQAACLASALATRMGPTFQAWKIGENGVSHPLAISADTLQQAVDQAAPCCPHKGRFVILETDAMGRERKLHTYAVRQKAPTWRHNPETKQAERFTPLFADHLVTMAVDTFVPVEPWAWSPGADVVGAERHEAVL